MQFGFIAGRNTTNKKFFVKQIQKKQTAKNRNMFFALVYLENVFGGVRRKVIWLALWKVGIPE